MHLPLPIILLLSSTATLAQVSLQPFTKLTCSSNNGLLPTPQYGLDGIIFSVCAQTTISARIQQVYDALLDFENYHLWNSFVVNVTLTPPPSGAIPLGQKMTFTNNGLIPFINVMSDEAVSILAPDVDSDGKVAINAWGNDGFGPKAQHPNILTDLGDGKTKIVSYESYYGVLSGTVTEVVLKEALQREFETQVEDLKTYVEGGGR